MVIIVKEPSIEPFTNFSELLQFLGLFLHIMCPNEPDMGLTEEKLSVTQVINIVHADTK